MCAYFFDILPYFRDFKDKLFFRFYGTSKRSSRFVIFIFSNCCISLILSNESNRSKLNVQSLISFECKIYLAWRIKMLNRSIFKIQFEVAD